MWVAYSISLIPINLLCNHILSMINKVNMLEKPTVVPPLAIISLVSKAFKRKDKEKVFDEKWLINNLKINAEEYNYLLSKVSQGEWNILHHIPRNYKEKKQIIEIKHKYLLLYRYDLQRNYTTIFNHNNGGSVSD